MADVTILNRKHHSGLDADKGGITGAFGETYAATDSGKLYYWNGSAWKTGLGYEFVERLVDAADFSGGNPTGTGVDFTTDGNWKVNGLDLSGIVPAGAITVKIKIKARSDTASSYLMLRRDDAHSHNDINATIYVTNVSIVKVEDISIDSDRLLDYVGSHLTFTTLEVTVLGWFI